jgi:hypothetical protein
MVDVAGAEEVLQRGFDETIIDRQSTMNQWALTREGGGLRVVTIEAGGIMVVGTAQEVSAHTKEAWRRGQVGADAVRHGWVGHVRPKKCGSRNHVHRNRHQKQYHTQKIWALESRAHVSWI